MFGIESNELPFSPNKCEESSVLLLHGIQDTRPCTETFGILADIFRDVPTCALCPFIIDMLALLTVLRDEKSLENQLLKRNSEE